MLGRTSRRNTAPGDWSSRSFARHTQPKHRSSPPGGGTMSLSSLTSAPSMSERSVVRPKGPAVLPARVEGPGGCHQHPIRPNGPTVPRTARASRGIVGPLGRHMSWSVLPGPLGRAGRTAGPLGRQTPAARPPAPQPTPAGSQRVAGGREQRPPPVTPPPKTPAPRSGCQKARLNRTVPGHQRVPPHLHHDAALLDPEAGMTSIRTTSLRQRRSTPVSRFAGPTWPRSTPSFGLRRWG